MAKSEEAEKCSRFTTMYIASVTHYSNMFRQDPQSQAKINNAKFAFRANQVKNAQESCPNASESPHLQE